MSAQPDFVRTLRSLFHEPDAGWHVLRITLAGLIATHGWARLLAGGVPPFGAFLESQGFPAGIAWAATVTGIEIVGSLLLLSARLVRPLTFVFAAIYAMGIVLVHAQAGWFVVGLGRNGAEYSVLLIVCLLCVGLRHGGRRGET